MRIELDDYSKEVVEKAEKITSTDYERKGNFLPLDSLISIIADLEIEIDALEEKVEYTEGYYQDNYEPISPYKMYGISERDFH